MQSFRSFLFITWLYLLMALFGVVCAPALLGPRSWARGCFWLWRRLVFGCLRWVGGVRIEVRGLANLPEGGFLVASRHESMFETLAMWDVLADPAIILKKELKWLPFFGWFAQKLDNIAVDRTAAAKALRDMKRQAVERIENGRQVLIFPEGTRTPPGETADYKPGVAALYGATNSLCVPVALNSGLIWKGPGLLKTTGTITIEILPAIPPGLNRKDFTKALKTAIDTASLKLYEEGV